MSNHLAQSLSRSRSLFASLALVSVFSILTPGIAGAEPAVIENDAPASGMVAASLQELWRIGGEDDEIIFGSVANIRPDAVGNLYLLDGQLAVVHILDPDGQWLRTIGGEGDGPGEVRRPSDMFVAGDGTICLLQGFPGRIVKLNPDGTPAGEAAYAQSADAQGQFGVLVRGLADEQGMTLAGIRMTFGGGGVSNQTYFLSRCTVDGLQTQALLEKAHQINYNEFALDELQMDFVWQRMTSGPGGRVYAAPERNRYEIQVFAPDGTVERIIRRKYEPLPRNDRQKKLAHQVIEAVGANYPTPPREITTEDTEPDIGALWVTGDGRLWVQSSQSGADTPDGSWAVLDVFDTEGRFEKQIALPGDHDSAKDAIILLDDLRLFVVVGALDAFLSQQAVGSDADSEAEEADPLEVICYRLAE